MKGTNTYTVLKRLAESREKRKVALNRFRLKKQKKNTTRSVNFSYDYKYTTGVLGFWRAEYSEQTFDDLKLDYNIICYFRVIRPQSYRSDFNWYN